MNCLEFAGIVRDYARQEWMSGPARAEAGRHIEDCADCRDRLARERELDESLDSLRLAQPVLQPPPLVRSAILAEFDKTRARPRRRGIPLAWGAVAAGLLVGALGLTWFRNDTPQGRNVPAVAARAKQPHSEVVAAEIEPALPPEVVAPAKPLVSTARRPRMAAAAPARERVTAFLPIGSGREVDPREEMRILRIQLPERELVRLGIPVAPRMEQGWVRADVLLGEDGLARAIRFVY